MIKTIIKETVIMLLLLAAIILAAGVLLYDYIPSSKIVPNISQYETEKSITEELAETISNEKQEVIITYEVDSKDLNIYEKTKDYNAGNPNPFSYYTTGTVNNNSNNTQNNNTNSSSNTTNSTTNNGTFFEDSKGTK